jgi:hypothetical protein
MKLARNKEVLKKLQDVDMEVLPNFDKIADDLIFECGEDAKKALKIALAYCSGYYKQAVPTNSLLTGRDGMVTIQMSVEKGSSLDQTTAMTLLQKYWAPKVAEQVKTMRSLTDGSGVCFDLRIRDAEGFIDAFEYLKEREGKRVDFSCIRCKSLPDLEPDDGAGS